jgi:hypothetical protein
LIRVKSREKKDEEENVAFLKLEEGEERVKWGEDHQLLC